MGIFMNEHLKPIFQVLLPRLEKAKIDYWIYGGISIAAYAGKFIRDNQDVDIFVKDMDFEQAKSMLVALCKKYNFKLKFSLQEGDKRPKIEIKIDNIKRFEMIPVYQKDNVVVFKYRDGNQGYPNKVLERVERNISGYRFFTSKNKFIREMFIKHIKVRPDKKKREKIIKDAKIVLKPDELSDLGFVIDTP